MVCEGEVTEPTYIRGYERHVRNASIEIVIAPELGVPKRLVEIAKEAKIAADAEAKRRDDDFIRFDETWCVFDIDQHPRVGEAREMARDNEIELAVSNPCFELWLLLHFRDSPGYRERHEIQKILRGYLPDYDKHVDFDLLTPGIAEARRRALRIDEEADQIRDPGKNPTTGVYRLVDSISRE